MVKVRKRQSGRKNNTEEYEFPVPGRDEILSFLEDLGKPITLKKLLKEFKLEHEEEQQGFEYRLRAMLRDGQLVQDRKSRYCLPSKLDLIKGTVISHQDGFGFIHPDDGSDDLFVSPRQMRRVFPGDRVLVQEIISQRKGKREAQIMEVIERNTDTLVGRLVIEKGCAFIEPLQKEISHDIYIPQDYLHDAKNGDLVNVKVLVQPDSHIQPIAEILEVINDKTSEAGVITDIAIKVHDIPNEWNDAVLAEIDALSDEVEEADKTDRADLRELPFVTIDGEDARDFDDAVYCKPLPKGGWVLHVAIADVSHYVRIGSALDEEAVNRGNSVYFPNRVVPMLPEKLSNGLCSLNPNVDRLSLVCEMKIDPEGKLVRYRFYDAVINSHARLTYTEVSKLYANEENTIDAALHEPLLDLYALYQVLFIERRNRGAIELETLEPLFAFDEQGYITSVSARTRNDAHKVIEECMLIANVAAARLIKKSKLPGLYRNHEKPSEERLENFRMFLGELGLQLQGGKKPQTKHYMKLLNSIRDRDDFEMIQLVALRSLNQACYRPTNEGHFGLAYAAYTHYTSPIRRYPDLLVHRAIKNFIHRKEEFAYSEKDMADYGQSCSYTERRADDATREVTDTLKCEFMRDKVGLDFSGKITSVTNFGVFVRLNDLFVEGLLHITQLKQDYYRFDAVKHRLVGERTNQVYKLLQPVDVKVARVSVEDREIDFVLSDEIDSSD